MIWPFKKRPTSPPQKLPPINEDWAVGDEAECVKGCSWFGGKEGPDTGDIFTVRKVMAGKCAQTGKPDWGLAFKPWPHAYGAFCFRKVRPVAVTAEWIERVMRGEPVQ